MIVICDTNVYSVGSATCRFVVDLSRRFSTLSFWPSGPNLHHVREDRGRYSICLNNHVGFHGGFSCSPDVDAARRLLQALTCRRHRRWGDGEGPTGWQSCRLLESKSCTNTFPSAVQDRMVPGWSEACRNRPYVCVVKSSTMTTLGSEFFSFCLFLITSCFVFLDTNFTVIDLVLPATSSQLGGLLWCVLTWYISVPVCRGKLYQCFLLALLCQLKRVGWLFDEKQFDVVPPRILLVPFRQLLCKLRIEAVLLWTCAFISSCLFWHWSSWAFSQAFSCCRSNTSPFKLSTVSLSRSSSVFSEMFVFCSTFVMSVLDGSPWLSHISPSESAMQESRAWSATVADDGSCVSAIFSKWAMIVWQIAGRFSVVSVVLGFFFWLKSEGLPSMVELSWLDDGPGFLRFTELDRPRFIV